MADLGMTVNVNEIPERQAFEPVPPGEYTCMIVASEMKPTKDQTGEMLVLEIDIQDGASAGRKLFERLNLKNKNDKAVEIAFQTLGEIIKAVGKTSIKDSNELHNKRFIARIEVEQGKPYEKDGVTKEGSPQNRIKKYMPVSGASSPQAAAAVAASPDAALPPWKRAK